MNKNSNGRPLEEQLCQEHRERAEAKRPPRPGFPPSAKRRRYDAPHQPAGPPPDALSRRQLDQIGDVIGQTLGLTDRLSGGAGSSSAGRGVLQVFAPGGDQGVALVRRSDNVLVSRAALQKACDAINRCQLAADHARKMFQNAGQGFEAERNTMTQSLELLKDELNVIPTPLPPGGSPWRSR